MAIMTRRSIRKYTNQQVNDELTQILLAGMLAPSAHDHRLAIHCYYRQRKLRPSAFHPYAEMLKQAPLAQICGDKKFEKVWTIFVDRAVNREYAGKPCPGLGSVWLAVYPRRNGSGITDPLQLPDSIVPVAITGYPAEQKTRSIIDPERLHFTMVIMNKKKYK
jgi:hypothetical protein